jgi:hypothetical protein
MFVPALGPEASDLVSLIQSTSAHAARCRKVIVCHQGHENDVCCTENIFEFLSAHGLDCGFLHLCGPHTEAELRDCLAHGRDVALLGFNSQLDHAWVDDEPLLLAAARHGVTVVQWILDHPSSRWPEFNYSNPATSRFLFHSRSSQAYFARYCCPGSTTATAGSVGPSWRSRSATESFEGFSQRPVACLIALGLTRLGKTVAETEADIEALGGPLARSLRDAVARARFDLDRPLEIHLSAALYDGGLVLDGGAFNRCFRLLNDSVQYLRRAEIVQVASRFGVHIQSDETARGLTEGGRASFRQDVSTRETLDTMPRCRAVLSASPINDSIHDRTCNALNAGCLPVVEDNRAHRELFVDGKNALLFRYGDGSLAECLALACGGPDRTFALAEAARTMRDRWPFRFGSFQNIVALAGLAGPTPPMQRAEGVHRDDGPGR